MESEEYDIESLAQDFNLGRVPYEATILYYYCEENGILFFGNDPLDLASNFGVEVSDLGKGAFFPIVEFEDGKE